MTTEFNYDPVWDDLYTGGKYQHAPWDCVVTFLFRNAPRDKARESVRVLEIGCGTASNLFFAAQQGFSVYGVDAAELAIRNAKKRFSEHGLQGHFETGDFGKLPFENGFFDLVIDRAALTSTSPENAKACTKEIARVCATGGRFFCNPYSDRHSSAASGVRLDTVGGGRNAPVDFVWT